MTTTTASTNTAGTGGFTGWWFGELEALAWRIGAGRPADLHWTGAEGGLTRADGTPAPRGRGRNATIVLGAGNSLERSFTLPLPTESRLADAVRFELPRQVPFSAEQVIWQASVTARDPAANRLTVRVRVAPRRESEPATAAARALGWRPRRIAMAGPDATHVIAETGQRRSAIPPMLAGGLAAGLAALACLAPMLAWEPRKAALTAAIGGLQARADALRGAGAGGAAAEAHLTALALARSLAPPTVAVWEAVSRALPDDAWTRSLTIADGQVVLETAAPSTAALVPLLEAAAELEDVRFSAATLDAAAGLERARIEARLVPPVPAVVPAAGQVP